MKTVKDYNNTYDAILEFESAVAEYTGAPYCVVVDCCTHAMELAFRLSHDGSPISFPARTYLSVLMLMHQLNIKYTLEDVEWRGQYQLKGSRVWDCARYFEQDMYKSGQIQCMSFNRTKPLEIGRGGCLLTDDVEIYRAASMMRSDGRDLFAYNPWVEQKTFQIGYHYHMKPEECIAGLNLLTQRKFLKQEDKFYNYPDCRLIEIESV
jgi:dTDP-4-amino-4,6-dideoxygalactose transaminase